MATATPAEAVASVTELVTLSPPGGGKVPRATCLEGTLMASVFRQTYKRPLPQSAELFTRKGVPMARWLDGRGRKRTAPVSEDGSSVVLEYTCWYVSYTDAARDRQTVRGFRDKEASE